MCDRKSNLLLMSTLADSKRLAQCVAASVSVPLAIGLTGTRGSGKTQLTKFICEALGIPCDDVTSPTFVLVHRYVGRIVVFHIDLLLPSRMKPARCRQPQLHCKRWPCAARAWASKGGACAF